MINPRIRMLRHNHHLSQETIANYLNCTQRGYSHYENGTREIPVDILMRLADFYNTSVDYLLGRTDETSPYPKGK